MKTILETGSRPTVKITGSFADRATLTCARRVMLERRTHRGDEPLAMRLGTAMHAALSTACLAYRQQPDRCIQAERLMQQSLDYTQFRDREELDQVRGRILPAIHGLYRLLDEHALQVLQVESYWDATYKVMADAANPFRLTIAGKIDVVFRRPDGSLLALDHKSGWSLPTLQSLARLPSTLIYEMLVENHLPNTSSISIGHWLPHTGQFVIVQPEPTDKAASRQSILALATAVHANQHPATRGPFCEHCPVQIGCPAYEERTDAQVLEF